ncbi:hypothetical protein HB943_11550 [Listeria weihenstephanensis]|uniref:Uncharacterized protein n=1 Tax=Listeria weihenstephanensis TaxID=1006155 RepID=A0A841Z7S3_9LIST|nr:hypothetical protein [Listeria weihenstephanensis]MBC1501238.1 hypothetical protein [Listeria weihenstephanensis]
MADNHIMDKNHLDEWALKFRNFATSFNTFSDAMYAPIREVASIVDDLNVTNMRLSQSSNAMERQLDENIITVINKMADELDTDVPLAFRSFDVTMEARAQEVLPEIENFEKLLDVYIDSIGTGGANIMNAGFLDAGGAFMTNRNLAASQVEAVKINRMAQATNEINQLIRDEMLKGKEVSDEEIARIIMKYTNGILTEEEFGLFLYGILDTKPRRVQVPISAEELAVMKSLGKAIPDPPVRWEFHSNASNPDFYGQVHSFSSDDGMYSSKSSFGNASGSYKFPTTPSSVDLKNPASNFNQFLQAKFGFTASLAEFSFASNNTITSEAFSSGTITLGEGKLEFKISATPNNFGVSANAIATVIKGEVTVLHAVDVGGYDVSWNVSGYAGAAGFKFEAVAGDNGWNFDVGGAALFGASTGIDTVKSGTDFDISKWYNQQ